MLAMMTQWPPSSPETLLFRVTLAVFLAIFTLGLILEARAMREHKARKSSPSGLDRPDHDALPSE